MFRTPLVVATLLVCALLAGCGGDDPKPDLADPTSSASSSVTTSAPTEASTSSTAAASMGPEETVRAWVKARNQALRDGDTTAAEGFGADTCKTCEDSLAPIRAVYNGGGHYETLGWTVLASKIEQQSATRAKISAGIEYEAGRTFPDASSAPVSYDLEKHIVEFRLKLDESSWRIAFIGYLS